MANRKLKKGVDISHLSNRYRTSTRKTCCQESRESLKIKVENIYLPRKTISWYSPTGEIADSVLVDSGLHYEATLISDERH